MNRYADDQHLSKWLTVLIFTGSSVQLSSDNRSRSIPKKITVPNEDKKDIRLCYEINNQANRGWRDFILRLIGVNLSDKRIVFTRRL